MQGALSEAEVKIINFLMQRFQNIWVCQRRKTDNGRCI